MEKLDLTAEKFSLCELCESLCVLCGEVFFAPQRAPRKAAKVAEDWYFPDMIIGAYTITYHDPNDDGTVPYSAATRLCTSRKYSATRINRNPLTPNTIGAVNAGTSHPETRFPIGMPPRNAKL